MTVTATGTWQYSEVSRLFPIITEMEWKRIEMLAIVAFTEREELVYFKSEPRSFAALPKMQGVVIFPKEEDFEHLNREIVWPLPLGKKRGSERTMRPAVAFFLGVQQSYLVAKCALKTPPLNSDERIWAAQAKLIDESLSPRIFGSSGKHTITELAAGDLFDHYSQGVPIPLENQIQIIEDLAKALDLLHRAGIVHGDIKPENTLIVNWKNRKALLTDFGNSSTIETYEPEVGTSGYFSPEQVSSCVNYTPIQDPTRCDLYGLGAIAYLLSTNELLPWMDKIDEVVTLSIKKAEEEDEQKKREISVQIDICYLEYCIIVADFFAKKGSDPLAPPLVRPSRTEPGKALDPGASPRLD